MDFDQLQVEFHITNEDEIDLACEFVKTFMYSELELLNENCSKMSNEERLRSLTLIRFIVIGCFRMVSRIESAEVSKLYVNVLHIF